MIYFCNIGGQTKEEAMKTQLRLRATRRRLEINYETAKQALVNLHNQYEKSKEVRNIFTRYGLLKTMIKVNKNTKFIVCYPPMSVKSSSLT